MSNIYLSVNGSEFDLTVAEIAVIEYVLENYSKDQLSKTPVNSFADLAGSLAERLCDFTDRHIE